MSFTKLRADPSATEWGTLHQPTVLSQKDSAGRKRWFLNSHPNKLNQVIKVQVFVVVSDCQSILDLGEDKLSDH